MSNTTTPDEIKYVLPSILDLDDQFSRTPNTIVFNELVMDRTPEEVIDILCDISSDKYDSVATCECGALVGNYYENNKCRQCGTFCKSTLYGEIRNDSWLEIPSSIKGVLNPQVFRVLSKWFGNFNRSPLLNQVLNMQLPQEPITNTPFFTGMGFNWFYDNFDAIINYYLTSHPSESGRNAAPAIKLFLERTGKAIWCKKLPILSKIIQPISRVSKTVRYADSDIKNLIKAIFTLRSVLLSEKMMKFSADHVDRHFYRVYGEFLSYTENILKDKLPKKPSILRKHVFGARSHCSCRSVAIPITEPHDSDEIYLPWKLGISVYFYHILAVLTEKRNIPVLKAYDRIKTAMNIYDHEIDLIMQRLIKDCPYKGLPILMNRNPSLRIASIQLLFVTKIKPALTKNPFTSIVQDIPDLISLERNEESTEETDESLPSSPFYSGEVETEDLNEQLTSYVEDGAIGVSPLIV